MAYFFIAIVVALVCGWISQGISSSRGMEGGFWWGFFLTIIGIVVVAVRPNDQQNDSARGVQASRDDLDDVPHIYICRECRTTFGGTIQSRPERCPKCGGEILETTVLLDQWRELSDAEKEERRAAFLQGRMLRGADSESGQAAASAAIDNAEAIRKYKGLLDDGIISQEEFEAKKKQLLGL